MSECFGGLREECGIFGVYGSGGVPAAQTVYSGLFALQHRGQESCGMALSDMGVISCHKNMGLVSEVFGSAGLASLPGQAAIGHVRYSTAGGSTPENSQPFVFRYAKGRFAIAHNGNLVNSEQIKDELALNGALFQSTGDSEVIAHIIAQERIAAPSIEKAVLAATGRLRGSYSLLVMSPRKIVAARDPFGFRPLVIGRTDGAVVFASESCALDAVGAAFERDVEPGEIVVADPGGLRVVRAGCPGRKRLCVFEYIYFARPDSVIDKVSVHDSRVKAGALLARQHPVEADVVIGVPDSGLDAAIGFSRESAIPFGLGFVRNNYVGRTFIKPEQSKRREGVDIKLSPVPETVKGKRVVMVDDSIVRGSTTSGIIRQLKAAGASQVHVRISSPTIRWPCYFGTDIPTRDELVANRYTVPELAAAIGADSLGFLAVESLREIVFAQTKNYCDACFTGLYPDAPPGADAQIEEI